MAPTTGAALHVVHLLVGLLSLGLIALTVYLVWDLHQTEEEWVVKGWNLLLERLDHVHSEALRTSANHNPAPNLMKMPPIYWQRLEYLLNVDAVLETSLFSSIREATKLCGSKIWPFSPERRPDRTQLRLYLETAYAQFPNEMDPYRNDVGFYFLIDQGTPEERQYLNNHEEFQMWVSSFVESWGLKLNDPNSRILVDEIIQKENDPSTPAAERYNLTQYYENPSNWTTFNQFFARSLRAGVRPIAQMDDPSVVVFPADSVLKKCCRIVETSQHTLWLKNQTHSIDQILCNSQYAKDFVGGTILHVYLSTLDYHRYHTPIGGVLLEKGRIHQYDRYSVYWNGKKGEIADIDPLGYQFNQTRGWLVLNTAKYGKVAVIPVGMGQVAGVNLHPPPELNAAPWNRSRPCSDDCRIDYENDPAVKEWKGMLLFKGQEFGYFLFGGSDIVVVFEKRANFALSDVVKIGSHHLQGEELGRFREHEENVCDTECRHVVETLDEEVDDDEL